MRIERVGNWKIALVQEHAGELAALENYLQARFSRWNPRLRTRQTRMVKLGQLKLKLHPPRWELPLGLLEAVVYHAKNQGIEFSQLFWPASPQWPLPERWRSLLREDQRSGLERLLKRSHGIFKAYTGFGKTEVQLALLESFLETESGKAVVLVPSRAVAEEWQLRMQRYGMESQRIDLIIPQGELRRSVPNLSHPEAYRLMVADEMHHLSAQSWNQLVHSLPQLEYSFGFSATPDLEGPGVSDPKAGFPAQGSLDWALRVGTSGPIRVAFSPQGFKQLQLTFLELPTPLYTPHKEQKYLEAVEELMFRPELLRFLVSYLKDQENAYFWPVPTISIGRKLLQHFHNEGLSGVVFWHANGYETLSLPHINNLETLKSWVEQGLVKLLLVSQVAYEGVDFPRASGVILAHGRNWRMNLQPLGRARAAQVEVLLPLDFNNGMMWSQLRQRLSILKEEYRPQRVQYLLLDAQGRARTAHPQDPGYRRVIQQLGKSL